MVIKNVTPILNLSSVAQSIAWFMSLGWKHGFVWPHGSNDPTLGGVCTEKAEVFLCQGAQGSRDALMPKYPGSVLGLPLLPLSSQLPSGSG